VAPLALVTTVVTVDLEDGFADRSFTPQVATAFPADYQLGGGKLTIDLTQIPASVVAPEVTATLGVGELILIIPQEAGLEIDGEIGIGAVQVVRSREVGRAVVTGPSTLEEGGVDVVLAEQIPATDGSPMITVHAHVSIGQLTIRRVARPAVEGGGS
jgi:hypothetical protein